MRKRLEWKWESLDDHTQRAQVIGGWLILRLGVTDVEKGKSGKIVFRESMVFISDPDHMWQILPPVQTSEPEIPY